jgi:hypothetical protein
VVYLYVSPLLIKQYGIHDGVFFLRSLVDSQHTKRQTEELLYNKLCVPRRMSPTVKYSIVKRERTEKYWKILLLNKMEVGKNTLGQSLLEGYGGIK